MDDSIKRDLLVDCDSLLALVLPLRFGEYGQNLAADYGEKIIASYEEIAIRLPQDACYALVAFIDESILLSRWAMRNEWLEKPMQQRYFAERLAGEGFFRRLSQLRTDWQQNIDVIELYYVCLQFGFAGKYAVTELATLRQLQTELSLEITDYYKRHQRWHNFSGPASFNAVMAITSRVPFWIMLSVTVALLLAIYIGFNWAINIHADRSAQQLQQLIESREAR